MHGCGLNSTMTRHEAEAVICDNYTLLEITFAVQRMLWKYNSTALVMFTRNASSDAAKSDARHERSKKSPQKGACSSFVCSQHRRSVRLKVRCFVKLVFSYFTRDFSFTFFPKKEYVCVCRVYATARVEIKIAA